MRHFTVLAEIAGRFQVLDQPQVAFGYRHDSVTADVADLHFVQRVDQVFIGRLVGSLDRNDGSVLVFLDLGGLRLELLFGDLLRPASFSSIR